eukprot:TRINITY_DN2189_c0_g1::TRINITY_DN2189_c0_g1_i1::g.12848::m.12848 TRINITY_DN2189_c0_g1::TRINITY_DN2189_c0_g1_i1::g.12848  ORF type:complete len:340 (-),score=37.74 TRINITY_DN2189_c0_g1_i1:1037-2056(-)
MPTGRSRQISKRSRITELKKRGVHFELIWKDPSIPSDLNCRHIVPVIDRHGVLSFDLPVTLETSFRLDVIITSHPATIPQRKTLLRPEWLESNFKLWKLIEVIGTFAFFDVPAISSAPLHLKPEFVGDRFEVDITLKRNQLLHAGLVHCPPSNIQSLEQDSLRLDFDSRLLATVLTVRPRSTPTNCPTIGNNNPHVITDEAVMNPMPTISTMNVIPASVPIISTSPVMMNTNYGANSGPMPAAKRPCIKNEPAMNACGSEIDNKLVANLNMGISANMATNIGGSMGMGIGCGQAAMNANSYLGNNGVPASTLILAQQTSNARSPSNASSPNNNVASSCP